MDDAIANAGSGSTIKYIERPGKELYNSLSISSYPNILCVICTGAKANPTMSISIENGNWYIPGISTYSWNCRVYYY